MGQDRRQGHPIPGMAAISAHHPPWAAITIAHQKGPAPDSVAVGAGPF